MASLGELVRKSLGIKLYLFAVFFKFWGRNLFKLSGKCGHLMIVWTTLKHGENCKINLFIETPFLS